MKTSGTLRQRLHAAAAEAMLDSAERAMIQHGYRKATMQQIAARAGCAPGTFYLYFKGKQELLQAIVARHAKSMYGLGKVQLRQAGPPVERLRLMLEAMLRYVGQHRPFYRLFFQAMPMRLNAIQEELDEASRRELAEFRQAELEVLQEAQRQRQVRRDLPAQTLQDFIQAIAFNMGEKFIFAAGRPDMQQEARVLWGLLAGGLGVRNNHAS